MLLLHLTAHARAEQARRRARRRSLPSQPAGRITGGELRSSVATSQQPYSIEAGSLRFESRDAFKAAVVGAGMSPAVAEGEGCSFNATGRQLRRLGFAVEMADHRPEEQQKAA